MSKPARGYGGQAALFAHKQSDLSKTTKIIATALSEVAVDQNYASMSFNYNVDNTINYIDIVKSVDGINNTVRLSFSYNASGLITGITKALQ